MVFDASLSLIFAEGDRPHLAAPIGAATRWGRFFSPSALVTSGAYRRPRALHSQLEDGGDECVLGYCEKQGFERGRSLPSTTVITQ